MEKSNVFLLSYAWNQDHTCFICGTTQGFRVFTVNPLVEVHRRERETANACALVAMLFKTNIFPLVRCLEQQGRQNSNRVTIWDDNKQAMVGELSNRHEVRGIVLRRDVIAMVCEYSIYLYTTDVLRLILHVATSCNARGLCALSPKDKAWVLCCPGQTAGTIRVQHGQVEEQQLVSPGNTSHVFTAHQGSLAALSINQTGTLIASASEQGTVVRVFLASNGQVLHELRRGSSPCTISCITFRSDDKYLAVASSSPTVHIFRLDQGGTGEGEVVERGSHLPELAECAAPPMAAAANSSGGATAGGAGPGGGGGASHLPEAVKEQIGNLLGSGVAERIKEGLGHVVDQLNNQSELKENLKNAVPRYFLASRSYAQFRIPDMPATQEEFDRDRQKYPDFRCSYSSIKGPLVCFGPPEKDNFYVLHYNGFIYEVNLLARGSEGADPGASEVGHMDPLAGAGGLSPKFRSEHTGGAGMVTGSSALKELVPGVQVQTQLVQAEAYFSSRPDFQMHKQIVGAEDEADWQLI